MTSTGQFPHLRQVVLDCPNPRVLAEFYRELLGFDYRPGDEDNDPAGDDWLVLINGATRVAFQKTDELAQSTWPKPDVPQQMHLDLSVGSRADLDLQHERSLALGARLIVDRSDDEAEPLRVYADPAGHPFCIFLAPDHPTGPDRPADLDDEGL